jgi:hypothetical protein
MKVFRKVRGDRSFLFPHFPALLERQLGEKLTQSITIENPIADTLLQGRWEIAPHPHDPPHTPDDHAWIAVTPARFIGNHTQCQVLVDTSKLMADKQYKRQLILHSNAYPQTHTLTVKVQTAALPIEKRKIPFGSLTNFGGLSPLPNDGSTFCVGVKSPLQNVIANCELRIANWFNWAVFSGCGGSYGYDLVYSLYCLCCKFVWEFFVRNSRIWVDSFLCYFLTYVCVFARLFYTIGRLAAKLRELNIDPDTI